MTKREKVLKGQEKGGRKNHRKMMDRLFIKRGKQVYSKNPALSAVRLLRTQTRP